MRRQVFTVLFGTAVLLFSAVAAEAQIKITGSEPAQVYHNQSQSTYGATVQWTGTFKWRLKVYYLTVEKWSGATYTVSSPGPSVNVSETVTGMNTWGMIPGFQLDYRGKAWVTTTNTSTHDLWVPIEQGTSKLIPDRKKLPLGDPDREVQLADVVRREEREWA
jgi:hypothetical protein